MRRLPLVCLVLAGWFAAGPAGAASPVYAAALIRGVPHVRQQPDFCGEACAEMALRKLGHAVDQDAVFEVAGVAPDLGRGCVTRELDRALRRLGFRPGEVWTAVPVATAPAAIDAAWRALHADLRRGIPSIVCTYYDDAPGAPEHFRLVLGYDPGADAVVFHEPAVDDGAYRRMLRPQFLALWPLKYAPREWTLVRLRLDPGEIRPPARPAGLPAAAFMRRVRERRAQLADEGFSVFVERPFVVIGDEHPTMVRRRAEGTVYLAVSRLRRDFFPRDPDAVLDIWLFRDEDSYRTHAQAIFGDAPNTPFGYYSAEHQALIMNIATGGGTLVHEIVHPLLRANFPACPDWFSEGLASLYEQSTSRHGHLVGLPNWRLPQLQEAIRAGTLPSFAQLTARDFYGADQGNNYAQARYLCYYLQEKNLLIPFYRRLVAGQTTDPRGYKALQETLQAADMAAFQRTWEAFVLGLRFP